MHQLHFILKCSRTSATFSRMHCTLTFHRRFDHNSGYLQKEYFQDDLYSPVRVTWEPTLTAEEFLAGTTRPQKTVTVAPPGMLPGENRKRKGLSAIYSLFASLFIAADFCQSAGIALLP